MVRCSRGRELGVSILKIVLMSHEIGEGYFFRHEGHRALRACVWRVHKREARERELSPQRPGMIVRQCPEVGGRSWDNICSAQNAMSVAAS